MKNRFPVAYDAIVRWVLHLRITTNRHVDFKRTVKMVFVIFFAAWFSNALANDAIAAYERYSPVSWWYGYEGVFLLSDKKTEDGTLVISSETVPTFKSEGYRRVAMQTTWYDTMSCEQNGVIRKYKTQVWPDFALEKESFDKTWAYTEEPTSPDATRCVMCGTIVGLTDLGFPKRVSYCTDWWIVRD